MAISVDWPASIIFVPKADTTFVDYDPVSGRERRTLDTEKLHNDLRDLEDDVEGRAFQITHTWSPNILGTTVYAPTFEILAPYVIEFEDGSWQVKLEGSNNNIDSRSVVNDVQIVPGNSGGLVNGDISDQIVEDDLTVREALSEMRAMLAGIASGHVPNAAGTMVFRNRADTLDRVKVVHDGQGNRSVVTSDFSDL